MVSILIPVYNTDHVLLKKSIESCLSQTYKNYEIIIVDNKSTLDSTIKTLEMYNKTDKISIYKIERQEGKKNISVALNYGLKKCKFNLIARMDSDDFMIENRIEKQVKYLEDNNHVDILGGNMVINEKEITNHPKIITKQIAALMPWFVNHPTVMFKKDKILKIGGYRESPAEIAEDYELWLRSLTNNLKIENMQDILIKYNYLLNNETSKTEKLNNYRKTMENIRMEFIKQNDLI